MKDVLECWLVLCCFDITLLFAVFLMWLSRTPHRHRESKDFIVKREIKTLAKRHRKVLIKLFQKFAVSKGRALVARHNERNTSNGVFFLVAFSFDFHVGASGGR